MMCLIIAARKSNRGLRGCTEEKSERLRTGQKNWSGLCSGSPVFEGTFCNRESMNYYVSITQYLQAVNYYEAALKSGQQSFFRQDLAELLFKLRNFDKCERVLKIGLEKSSLGALG